GGTVVEGGESADGRLEGGDVVDESHADLVGRAVRRTGDAHQPRHRLDQQVVASQFGRLGSSAEGADRHVDETGVVVPHRLIVEPEAGEGASGLISIRSVSSSTAEAARALTKEAK